MCVWLNYFLGHSVRFQKKKIIDSLLVTHSTVIDLYDKVSNGNSMPPTNEKKKVPFKIKFLRIYTHISCFKKLWLSPLATYTKLTIQEILHCSVWKELQLQKPPEIAPGARQTDVRGVTLRDMAPLPVILMQLVAAHNCPQVCAAAARAHVLDRWTKWLLHRPIAPTRISFHFSGSAPWRNVPELLQAKSGDSIRCGSPGGTC